MHTVVKERAKESRAREMSTPVATPVGDAVVARGIAQDQEENKTIWWWVGMFAVFIFWGWVQSREKITNELQPRNIHANLHNLGIIAFAAVIGIVGGQVLFTKLAALCKNIPLLNRVTAYLAQLFGAA